MIFGEIVVEHYGDCALARIILVQQAQKTVAPIAQTNACLKERSRVPYAVDLPTPINI